MSRSGAGGDDDDVEPRIVCLLPVRNAADVLPGWLDEAAGFVDAVVALDDGSTDGTGAILAAHPLVASIITNERRDGYLGWHDGRNRNRLLAAAAALAPDWIFSLDADERLDPTDAVALRRFVATEALPFCAYGFRLYRMRDGDTYDPDYEWVYRLFAFKSTSVFLNRRLDLIPVPTEIGPQRWVATTLRIKHYGEVDEAGRDERVAKFREADPEGAFRYYYENLAPTARGPFPRWRPRASEMPFLPGAVELSARGAASPHVVCLLPARNCADLLPGWFECVSRVADAIVALDDGSTDETRRLLDEHPLVVRVLTNPPRPPGYHDWDDGDNRNRLLAAAAELSPAWVISVDADERIPLEDAAALRRFLHNGAEPGYGYALASYRMIGDEDHYDRLDYDAYRLFAFEPGHVFPMDRLHAPPIPTAIPPDRWRQTTIRMKHLVSLTEAHRRARQEKFRHADPDCVWEPDYGYTIEDAGPLKTWEPRPLDLPVVVTHATPGSLDDLDVEGPVLTVVVAVEPGEEHESVAMLHGLAVDEDQRIELLALTRDGYAAGVLRREVANIVVVEVAPYLTEAGLRNTALDVARGDYVTFLEIGDRVDPDGLHEMIDAHDQGHGALTVRVAEPPTSPAAWAELLLSGAEHGSVYASFVREPLRAIGGFDERVLHELDVGAAQSLLRLGFTVAAVSSVVRRGRSAPSVVELLRRRFATGRHTRVDTTSGRTVAAWRDLSALDGSSDASRPVVAGLVAAGAAASWLGRAAYHVRPRRPRRPLRPRRP